MSRYQRMPVCTVADPVGGMRVYGRGPSGAITIVVVHSVERDNIYYARRVRGLRGSGWGHNWTTLRMPAARWTREAAGAFAVRLPAVEAAVPVMDI